MLEKVIHDQTSNFLNSKNVSYTYQFGFPKKHSTDFCLSYLNDKILKYFDRGMMTGMILINLQKAFGTIDHEVLLHLTQLTMTCYCRNYMPLVSQNVLLIGLGLSNRSFHVNLRNNFS